MTASRASEFSAFVSRDGAALVRLGTLLAGSVHGGEDLTAATLARVWTQWERVASADSPSAYVRTMLVREHHSLWRRRASHELLVADPVRSLSSPDPAVAVADRAAAWQLLAGLPRRQRTVLVLRYYADMSDAQIAAALGIRESTVRSNAARALESLRLVVRTSAWEVLP